MSQTQQNTNGTSAPAAEVRPKSDLEKLIQEKPLNTLAFEPQNITDGIRLAEYYIDSGLLPRSIQNPAAIMIIAHQGRELGLSFLRSLRGIHIIEGKPALSAELARELAHRAGAKVEFILSTTTKCTCRVTAADGRKIEVTWTTKHENDDWQSAERASLLGKGPWKTYPAAMLRARASGDAIRALVPEALGGLYLVEEVEGSGGETNFEPAPLAERRVAAPIVTLAERQNAASVRLKAATEILGKEVAAKIAGPRPEKGWTEWMEQSATKLEAEVAKRAAENDRPPLEPEGPTSTDFWAAAERTGLPKEEILNILRGATGGVEDPKLAGPDGLRAAIADLEKAMPKKEAPRG